MSGYGDSRGFWSVHLSVACCGQWMMWDWNDRKRSMHTASRGFVTSVSHSPPVRMYTGCTPVQEEIVNSMYSIYSYIVNHVTIAYVSPTIFPWKQTKDKSPFCLFLFFVFIRSCCTDFPPECGGSTIAVTNTYSSADWRDLPTPSHPIANQDQQKWRWWWVLWVYISHWSTNFI